jgi:D-serine deaminase-like pyridoxal phosphate-dependent protein
MPALVDMGAGASRSSVTQESDTQRRIAQEDARQLELKLAARDRNAMHCRQPDKSTTPLVEVCRICSRRDSVFALRAQTNQIRMSEQHAAAERENHRCRIEFGQRF